MYLDFDRFKEINDSLGHSAGDELLRIMAHRLRQHLRSSDTLSRTASQSPPEVSRLGGDEFAILMSRFASIEDVKEVATRILGLVADPVTVEFPAAVEPGMKIKGDPLAGSHRDIPGQQTVHAFLQILRRKARAAFEMGGLSQGMDTGIGPACPADLCGCFGKTLHPLLKNALDSHRIILHLPAVIRGTVIFYEEPGFFHGSHYIIFTKFPQ